MDLGSGKSSQPFMKQFVVRAYDGEGMLDKRMEVRPRHLEGMERMREHVIRAGMAAPTAVNKQPWHFVAVTSKDKLKEMAVNNPNAKMLEQAPLTIVVCGDMQKTLEGEARALWIQDCSAATENILLAAHGLGLGAVWTALYLRDERAKSAIEALKLPDHIVPLCAIIIGHPSEQPEPKDKWKPENVSYNEFGGKAE